MIRAFTLRYLALFVVVLLALNAVAYFFLARMYGGLLQPLHGSPEYAAAYALAMQRATLKMALFDVPLLVVVGLVSYLLARATLEPLLFARERERRFAADAAHELRSPLATIATVAQVAGQDAPAQVKDQLETIARTALDASAIVADLLTLAREPGPHALHKETIDLAIVARQCAQEFEERAHQRNVRLEVETQSALVDADERRIRELLRNLIENALRHARSSIRIRSQAAGRTATLTVSDDGPGIEPALREHIFERFYRANGQSNGLGLGLSIGRWIADAHGGELRALESPQQTGATFVLRLPALPT